MQLAMPSGPGGTWPLLSAGLEGMGGATSQTATILVTDLVGSTERRVARGEERAEVLRRTHDRLLTEAVTRHGGEVIKGLGDGVLAVFVGAAEAVAAAVAIQQAIAAHLQRHPEDLLVVRIGISAGDVTLEDSDCFGTPVVEASRLCADAAGDEILVADLVRLLARGRGDHVFTPAGEQTLKGLPEPVPVATVSWSRAIVDGSPMPSALRVAQWYDFAGRTTERDALLERWKKAAAGAPGLVVVSGEPGIGKTRLVAELASSAHGGGATVLYGRSEEELDVPFRPWAEALGHLVAHLSDAVLTAHLHEWGGDIGRLVTGLDVPEPPRTDPDSERLRLFGAVTDLLTRAGEESPLLVVLDDLHWADESSLPLLRHLVRNVGEARVLVVGTYRDTDLARTHPLAAALADLRREAGVERVDLTGLGHDEVTVFLSRAGGGEVDPEQVAVLAEMVWRETEGNPFFIGEILVHLVESGALVHREGRWEGDRGLIEQIGLPEGIREVIGRRLAGLDEATNELLRAAAVIGSAFDAAVLAAVAEREVDDVVTVLDAAGARRLVVEDDDVLDRFRFAHALVRQTILEELWTSRRVRLHHRVALALEARGASPADLVHHFGEAAALADPPDPARRAELRLALGEARNVAGDPAAARPDLLARAAYGYGYENAVWLDFSDTVGPALLAEALEVLPADRTRERARCLTQSSMWRVLDVDLTTHVREAQEGLRLAEESGDVTARYRALDIARQAFTGSGDLDAVLDVANRMATLGDESGDLRCVSLGHYGRMVARLLANDLDAARSLLIELLAMDRRRLPLSHWWGRVCTAANLAILDGRWDEVLTPTAEETAAIGMTGATIESNHQMRVLFDRGDRLAAARVARDLGAEHGEQLAAWPHQAWSSWYAGEDEAAEHLARWHRDVFEGVPAAFRLSTVATATPIAVDHGLTVVAADLADELRTVRGRWASWSVEIADRLVDHCLGALQIVLGETQAGEATLRTAVADYRRAGTRARLTYALADLAVLTEDAAARTEALALADDLGMKGVTARLSG